MVETYRRPHRRDLLALHETLGINASGIAGVNPACELSEGLEKFCTVEFQSSPQQDDFRQHRIARCTPAVDGDQARTTDVA